MSQQDQPQDNQDNPPASEAGSWTTPPATNRPAEGATRVASLHQAEQTWRAGEGATDFLGLEQDGGVEVPAPAQPAAEAGVAEANPTQAWLFHMENEARGAAPQAAAAPAAGAPAEWSTESLVEGQETDPMAETVPPSSASGAFGDEIELGGESGELSGELELAGAEAPSRRKTQWLVAAGLAVALLGAGGWQIWNSSSKSHDSSSVDPLVWRSGNHKPPAPKPKPPVEAPGETPTVAQAPSDPKPGAEPNEDPTPAGTQPPAETPVAVDPAKPTKDPEPSKPVAVVGTNPPEPAPGAADPAPEAPPTPTFAPILFANSHASDVSTAVATPRGARRPDAAEVAGLWTDHAIPFEAIAGQAQLRTPGVGAVRVLLKNGEHFQGRLHSVGQGQVSMDVDLGRMSVEYSDVSEIVQILEADLTKKPSKGLPEETAGLMYVTAKVPGGYLTGWLVQRAEGKLTLITEEAKKITVDDEGFEPVSKGRARVVGTVGRGTADAGSALPKPSTETPKLKSGPAGKPAPAKPAPAKPAPAKPKH